MSSMDDVVTAIRKTGWRQGDLLTPETTKILVPVVIDHFPNGLSLDNKWLIIITQDCDLVRKLDDEPYIEFLLAERISQEPNNPMRGQSARNFHFRANIDEIDSWFSCAIHNRFRITKAVFIYNQPARSYSLNDKNRGILLRWLARRYTRAAFPDRFENNLESTKGRVKSLFKSAEAKLISTIYIAIENEGATDGESYRLRVLLTASASDLSEQSKRQMIDDFEQRFIEVFSAKNGISFVLKDAADSDSVDVRVISEEDVTLAQLRQFKRFDADYRSIDDDTAEPPTNVNDA